ADSFSILGQTLITGISTISGDVGSNNVTGGVSITALTTGDVAGTIFATDLVAPSEGIIAPAVQTDASAEFNVGIPGQASNATIVGNLDGQSFTPGVYDQGALLLAGGTVTLDGAGIYIFRSASDLTSAGTVNLINGARACDVYWRVQTSADINGTAFVGTILAGAGVHFGAGVTLDGRALAVGADVTLGVGGTISGPSCISGGGGGGSGGGGGVQRPRIHVEKIATPDELPDGPGTVVYDYAVTNLGKSLIQNIEVTDDTCSSVEFVSGDTDDDEKLDTDEEWNYECTMRLSLTTTNVVTTTGEASSGRETKDTDEATVVVGMSRVLALPLSGVATTTPRFPSTGVSPREGNPLTNVLVVAGLGALGFFALRKRRVI
ncbi:MAG: ice-binding family protein, partial [Candidatus Kaiserbacteria bacterium]|nr:ice-binding family protein [Candidatus Kaiserbacteria bacterium]